MEEETTTPTSVDTGAPAQPVASEPVEAVYTTSDTPVEQSTQEGGADKPSEPVTESDDDKLAKWAESKGLELDSENAKKAAKMAREAEKAMHSKAQKASELEKAAAITEDQVPQDAAPEVRDTARMRNLELKFEVQQWKMQNPDKLNQEANMVQILADPVKKALVQEGYLSVDDVYAMAAGNNSEAVKSQVKQDTLTSLAQRQQAAVPTGAATTSGTPKGKPFAEKSIAEMEAELGFHKV